MNKRINNNPVNILARVLMLTLGIFVFVSCDKSSPEDGPGGGLEPDPDAVLVAISVKSPPAKTGYFIGEKFSDAGLIVEGKYDNGDVLPIDSEKLEFAGFNSNVPDPQLLVKISYNSLFADLTLEVYPFKVQEGNEIVEYVENATSVVIPAGVVRIAADVFIGKAMKQVTFPETLKEIGDYAFYSCYGLESVVLPSSLQKVGEGVFDNCISLVSADLSRVGLTEVGAYMFSRCSELSDVKLSVNTLVVDDLSFYGTDKLRSIVIPENTRFIGLDAFRESGLERIELPNNLKVIRQRAFLDCNSLKEVLTYGNYVPSDDGFSPLLEFSSFQSVPALTKLEIPMGITILGSTILSGCPLLNELTIPATVTQIGYLAFENTTLKRIIMTSTTPPTAVPMSVDGRTWHAFPSTAVIEVPIASVDSYKQAFGWSLYTDVIRGY